MVSMKVEELYQRTLKIVFFVTIAMVGVISLLGFFSHLLVLELLSHFRLLYALLLAFLLVLAISLRLRGSAIFASILLLINLMPIARLLVPTDHQSISGNDSISLLQMNIRPYQNHEYDKVLRVIEDRDADIVGVIELKKDWTDRILVLKQRYPYVVKEEANGGIMMLSKYPLISPKLEYTGRIKRPRISTRIKRGKTTFSIILAHTVSPRNDLVFRNQELGVLGEQAKSAARPLILFGDLNCSPFSFYFDRLLKTGELTDSENGFGINCTWPAYIVPFVPIDHVLISKELACTKRIVGPNIGSDHLPVYAEISVVNR